MLLATLNQPQEQVSVGVCVLFFASVKDRLGKSEERVKLPSTTWQNSAQLIAYLCHQVYPTLIDLQHCLALAVNEEYAIEGQLLLEEDDRLALIPPITGG